MPSLQVRDLPEHIYQKLLVDAKSQHLITVLPVNKVLSSRLASVSILCIISKYYAQDVNDARQTENVNCDL